MWRESTKHASFLCIQNDTQFILVRKTKRLLIRSHLVDSEFLTLDCPFLPIDLFGFDLFDVVFGKENKMIKP